MSIREAARKALGEHGGYADEVDVRRLILDVTVGGQSELVTVELVDGGVRVSGTGPKDAPHYRAALAFVAGESSESTGGGGQASDLAGERVSWVDPELARSEAARAQRHALAAALEDVVTLAVRVGTREGDAPSLTEGLKRLRKAAPKPLPLPMSRWFDRLSASLRRGETDKTARLLYGAARLSDALRKEEPTPKARGQVVAWLGSAAEVGALERVQDRQLVEVARERLSTDEWGGLERRYLCDLHNGEVYREERRHREATVSVGPCPRRLDVGLAEVEGGAAPRRIRLMQYAVSLSVSAADLARIEANAYRRFVALADRYRAALRDHPAQTEPFAVVAPDGWKSGPEPLALDGEGFPLPFARADDPGGIAALAALTSERRPRWVAGRLTDADGTLMMVPCSVGLSEGGEQSVVRLR